MATTYTFRFTDGTKNTFQIAPFTANGPDYPGNPSIVPPAVQARTDLLLYGQGMPDYGLGIEQDLLYMLENFANDIAPLRSIEGQEWFNNNTKELFIYNNSAWGAIILASGTSAMTADLNMGAGSPPTNKIVNLSDPTNPQDAVTLSYADATYLNASGGIIDGDLIVTGDILITMGSPVNPLGVINKDYADSTYLALAGGTMTGDIIMPFGAPTNPLGVISELYADTRYLELTGGVLSGTLTLFADPINPLEAATMQYVDAAISSGGDGVLTNIYFIANPTSSPPTPVVANADTMIFARSGGLPDIEVFGLEYSGKIKPAGEISYNPPVIGDVTTSDVQSAIDELDNKKLSITGGFLTGDLDMITNRITNLPAPVADNDAVSKAYVDSVTSSIQSEIFSGTGVTLYNSFEHLAGDNKQQIFVNGQKKYVDSYGYSSIQYFKSVLFLSPFTLTNLDPAIVDYNFDITIDNIGGSPVYNITLPAIIGSPSFTPNISTHEDLINTINIQLSVLAIPNPPIMSIANIQNSERILSPTQGSISNVVISNSGTGTYLFDIPAPIPIDIVNAGDGLGSPPIYTTFEFVGDQTSILTVGKTFTVQGSATATGNFDGIYTIGTSIYGGVTTVIDLATPLAIVSTVVANGDIHLTQIGGLEAITVLPGNDYDYSETDDTGVNVIQGGITTNINFKTTLSNTDQVEMILFS